MVTDVKKKSFKEKFTFVSTVISWTIFVLLFICAILLFYYFISTKLYAAKGDKFEPKFSLYTIISPSMTPNINVYDVIVNWKVKDPRDIKIGDVLTFTSSSTESMGKTVTHRVVSIMKDADGNYSYQVKGDSNLLADSASVPFNKVIGKVALRLPQLGRVQLFMASAYGWLCLILIPALYIIFKDLFKLLKLSERFKDHKILGKKLLMGRRPKLLPEPKLEMGSIPDDYESAPSSETHQKEGNVVETPFFSITDTSDDDFDLPDLK